MAQRFKYVLSRKIQNDLISKHNGYKGGDLDVPIIPNTITQQSTEQPAPTTPTTLLRSKILNPPHSNPLEKQPLDDGYRRLLKSQKPSIKPIKPRFLDQHQEFDRTNYSRGTFLAYSFQSLFEGI